MKSATRLPVFFALLLASAIFSQCARADISNLTVTVAPETATQLGAVDITATFDTSLTENAAVQMTLAGSALAVSLSSTDGVAVRSWTAHAVSASDAFLLLPPGDYSLAVNVQTVSTVDGAPVDTDSATKTLHIVIPDIPTLSSIVNRMAQLGLIKRQMVNPLQAKLSAAQSAVERGKDKTAANILKAFDHHVRAQTGKKINAQAAAKLRADAQTLIQDLKSG